MVLKNKKFFQFHFDIKHFKITKNHLERTEVWHFKNPYKQFLHQNKKYFIVGGSNVPNVPGRQYLRAGIPYLPTYARVVFNAFYTIPSLGIK